MSKYEELKGTKLKNYTEDPDNPYVDSYGIIRLFMVFVFVNHLLEVHGLLEVL